MMGSGLFLHLRQAQRQKIDLLFRVCKGVLTALQGAHMRVFRLLQRRDLTLQQSKRRSLGQLHFPQPRLSLHQFLAQIGQNRVSGQRRGGGAVKQGLHRLYPLVSGQGLHRVDDPLLASRNLFFVNSPLNPSCKNQGIATEGGMQMTYYAVLGTPGFIRQPSRFGAEALLAALGANSGNLMFQLAVARMIAAPLKFLSASDTPYEAVDVRDGARALIVPAANHLRCGADWSGLCDYLEGSEVPLIVFGLGAQAPGPGGEAETIRALHSDAKIRRLVDVLRDKASLVTVRGPFSQTCCEALGLQDTALMGCPSAFLNRDPVLGQKLEAALKRGLSSPPRLAVNAAAPFEVSSHPAKREIERLLFRWMQETRGLYIQQSGGISVMKAALGGWHEVTPQAVLSLATILSPDQPLPEFLSCLADRGRFYLSAPEWINALRHQDLVIGTRLHGAMAGLAAGIPGVIITHDSRTSELAETMHLPRLAMADLSGSPGLAQALSRITFDGGAFDRWRANTADQLAHNCAKIGLPLCPEILGLCPQKVAA
jgi:hypothetical protein